MNLQRELRTERIGRVGVVLWALLAAGLVGVLLPLVIRRSAEGIYQTALIPLLLAGFLAFAFSVRQGTRLAPILILAAALFIPLRLPTGTESQLVDSLLLTMGFVVIWLLRMFVADRKLSLIPHKVNRPVLLFMLVAVIAWIWGIIFRDPFVFIWRTFPFVQLASLAVMLMLPSAMLLVANAVRELRLLRIMVWLMMIAGAAGLVSILTPLDLPVNTRGLFSMWVVALGTGLALFHRGMGPIPRLLSLAIAGFWLYQGFVVNITWLAGWVPLMVVVASLAFFRSKKLFFLLAAAFLVLILTNQEYYLGSVLQAEAQESLFTRQAAWEINWRVTSQHLLFGTGPAGYAAYYISYFPTQAMATHSNYIDLLSQTGVVGLLIFFWFLMTFLWSGYRFTRSLRGRGDFQEALANTVLAGSIGVAVIMAFGDWLIPFAYTQSIEGFDHAIYSWLFMGALLSLQTITAQEAEPDE